MKKILLSAMLIAVVLAPVQGMALQQNCPLLSQQQKDNEAQNSRRPPRCLQANNDLLEKGDHANPSLAIQQTYGQRSKGFIQRNKWKIGGVVLLGAVLTTITCVTLGENFYPSDEGRLTTQGEGGDTETLISTLQTTASTLSSTLLEKLTRSWTSTTSTPTSLTAETSTPSALQRTLSWCYGLSEYQFQALKTHVFEKFGALTTVDTAEFQHQLFEAWRFFKAGEQSAQERKSPWSPPFHRQTRYTCKLFGDGLSQNMWQYMQKYVEQVA